MVEAWAWPGRYGPPLATDRQRTAPAACRSIPRPSAASPQLARIRVEEPRSAGLQGELNGILGWIEQLNEVDVEGVEPLTGGAQMALRMREDAVTDGGWPRAVLANAPDREGDFFAVPKVVRMMLRPSSRPSPMAARTALRAPRFLRARADARRISSRGIEALNPRLNAYITVTPEKARSAGRCGRCGAGGGERGAAGRHSAGDQGSVLHRGRADHGRQPHPGRLRAALREHGQRATCCATARCSWARPIWTSSRWARPT